MVYIKISIATDLNSGWKTLISGNLMACDRFLVYTHAGLLGGYYSHIHGRCPRVELCSQIIIIIEVLPTWDERGKIVQMRKFHFRRVKYINMYAYTY